MDQRRDPLKKIFTYEEAVSALPDVQRITAEAVAEIEALTGEGVETQDVSSSHEEIVARWAASILDLGIEVKGLWLIDFDCGSGYYCWKYPESSLQFFHDYESGFGGRVRLN